MVNGNLKYPKATVDCINFLASKAHENDLVRVALTRRAKEWVGAWLLDSVTHKVQETAFLLLSQILLASDVKASNVIFQALVKVLPEALAWIKEEQQKQKGKGNKKQKTKNKNKNKNKNNESHNCDFDPRS